MKRREQISELPLRNRDFSRLITLQAGTVQYRHAAGSAIAGFGARISVSGARPSSNSFTLDGADINTLMQHIPSGIDGTMLGVEAIREFKVLDCWPTTPLARISHQSCLRRIRGRPDSSIRIGRAKESVFLLIERGVGVFTRRDT